MHVNVRRGLGAAAAEDGAGAGTESADAFFARVHAANLNHLQADADAGAAESVTGGARPRLVRAAPGGLLAPRLCAGGASGGARARRRAPRRRPLGALGSRTEEARPCACRPPGANWRGALRTDAGLLQGFNQHE